MSKNLKEEINLSINEIFKNFKKTIENLMKNKDNEENIEKMIKNEIELNTLLEKRKKNK
jgi:hypothetical protein